MIIIAKIIMYYLLIGTVFTLAISQDLSEVSKSVENDEEAKKISKGALKRIVIVTSILLWPVYVYQLSQK